MRRTTTVFLCGLLLATGCKHFSEQTVCSADVIVYGGTSAGVVAAVQAARLGKSVILVSPDKHLGGLSSGGLGWTDSGKADSIGGMSREFYQRIYTYYAQPGAWRQETMDAFRHIKGQGTKARNDKDQTQWLFEPHVAEQYLSTGHLLDDGDRAGAGDRPVLDQALAQPASLVLGAQPGHAWLAGRLSGGRSDCEHEDRRREQPAQPGCFFDAAVRGGGLPGNGRF